MSNKTDKRTALAKTRFETAHKLSQAGVKYSDIAKLLGLSTAAVTAYMAHNSYQDFREYNVKKASEKRSPAPIVGESLSPERLPEQPTNLSHDIAAHERMNLLETELAQINERLAWLESNAVISNTRRNLWRAR